MTYVPSWRAPASRWPAPASRWTGAVVVVEAALALVLLGAVHGRAAQTVALPVVALAVGSFVRRRPRAWRRPYPAPGAGYLAAELGLTAGLLRASSTLDGVGTLSDGAGHVLVLEVGGDPGRLLDGGTALASLGGPAVRRAQLLLTPARDPAAPRVLLALRCPGAAAPQVLRRAVRALGREGVPVTPVPAERIVDLLAECAFPTPPTRAARARRGWYQCCLSLCPAGGRRTRRPDGRPRDSPDPAPAHAVWVALAGVRAAAALAVGLDRATGPGATCALTVRLMSPRPGDLAAAERTLRRVMRSMGVRVDALTGHWAGLIPTLPLAADSPTSWAPPAAPSASFRPAAARASQTGAACRAPGHRP